VKISFKVKDVSKTANTWQIYRTRFLIRARQLTKSLVFVDPLGREHRGKKGDYLVESSDGARNITPRQIFEDIYVALGSPRPTLALNPSAPLSRRPLRSFQPTDSVGTMRKGPVPCGKPAAHPRIPPVNCLRYNM
jgi:hypothetical protein